MTVIKNIILVIYIIKIKKKQGKIGAVLFWWCHDGCGLSPLVIFLRNVTD